MPRKGTARAQLVAAALLFSTGGAAIKWVDFGAMQIAGLRSGIAAFALLLLLPAARRGWSWRTAVVAVGYAATLVLFVVANRLTTAANTIFLQSTAPLYLLLLGPWLLKEPIHRRDFAFMLLEKGNVAVSPGSGFGPAGEGFLRMSLVENESRLKQAVRQIKACLRDAESTFSTSATPQSVAQ